MNIVCFFLGHKRVHRRPLKTPKNNGTFNIHDHCDRCKKVLGVWIWFKGDWVFYK